MSNPVAPSVAWLQLYCAALTGLCRFCGDDSPDRIAEDAKDTAVAAAVLADAAARLVAERLEIAYVKPPVKPVPPEPVRKTP